MQTLPLSSIIVSDRLRADLGDIESLAADIEDKGLIQPLVLTEDNGTYRLVAGGRRHAALTLLGVETLHHGITCDPSRPGFVFSSELSPERQRECEIMENLQRQDMTWTEYVRGAVELHRLYSKRAALDGTKWTQQQTADRLGYDRTYVSHCLDIFPDIDTPLFADCQSLTDAIKKRAEQRMQAAVAEQTRRTIISVPAIAQKQLNTPMPCVACEGTGKHYKTGEPCRSCNGLGKVEQYDIVQSQWPVSDAQPHIIPISNSLFFGDSAREILPQWPDASVDHIITDPPYAIDMAMLQQSGQAMIDTTNVDSTHDVKENLDLLACVMPQLYRVLKPTGYCILFLDIMRWQYVYDLAISAGFRVQRWPLFWRKLHQCKNQYATVNFTKDVEFAIVCRKSEGTLPRTVQTCCVSAAKDPHTSNPFAKPFDVWKFLIESVSLENQTILDPFAGEGSCPLSCLRLNRKPIAIEKDEIHFAHLVQGVKTFYTDKLPNVVFQ
jgi:DNA modification methylase